VFGDRLDDELVRRVSELSQFGPRSSWRPSEVEVVLRAVESALVGYIVKPASPTEKPAMPVSAPHCLRCWPCRTRPRSLGRERRHELGVYPADAGAAIDPSRIPAVKLAPGSPSQRTFFH